MSTPDHADHESDEDAAAKTGATPHGGDSHGAHDAHGAHDDAGHGPQAAPGTFIEEDSPQDKVLSFLVAPLAGLGLIVMMLMFYLAPIEVESVEHGAPVAPAAAPAAPLTPGERVPASPPIR